MQKSRLRKILKELHSEFSIILDERLDDILLFGSQARGDARVDSDIDILVIINGDFNYGDLIKRTSSIVSDLSLEYDVAISRAFMSKDHFEHDQDPFLLNVRREGVRI
jgi:predicted nucleotidyltransferase